MPMRLFKISGNKNYYFMTHATKRVLTQNEDVEIFLNGFQICRIQL